VFGYLFSTLAVILVSDILKTTSFHIESGNGPMIISVVSSLKEDIEADTLRQPRVFHGPLTFCSRDESCQARALGFPCRTNIAIVTRLSKHTLWDSPEEGALQS